MSLIIALPVKTRRLSKYAEDGEEKVTGNLPILAKQHKSIHCVYSEDCKRASRGSFIQVLSLDRLVTTMLSERARNYDQLLRESAEIPVDSGNEFEMVLPSYADHEKISRAQNVFKKNFFAIFYGMYCGLLAILAIPTIINVLVHTDRSSSDMTAYKRYIRTIYHTLTWFRHDLKPKTRAWRSLEAVRKLHLSANKSSKRAKVGMISQLDMAITQYGFIGFTIVSQKKVGVQATKEEMTDYIHFWRVLGHILGIRDDVNLCAETFEETMERLEVVRKNFLLPALQFPPEQFPKMTKHIVDGLWCFNPADAYNVLMFEIKRYIGLPNFEYLEEEIPKDCDRSKLEIYKMSYYERFEAWTSWLVHEYLLQFGIIRWLLNMDTRFHEFLITYFPFLAFYKFGLKNAYVRILRKDE